jgi:hypothetical protein
MNRKLTFLLAAALLCANVSPAAAQRQRQEQDLPLPQLNNAGPCPYVKVLYDASRTIEFASDTQAASNVAWSGEIQGVSATCSYAQDEPVTVQVLITFAIGRGPQAQGLQKTMGYWVAVTARNSSIIGKENFAFTANFPANADRVLVFEQIDEVIIPRGSQSVSGAAYEVLVGFDVTPEMAEFNRQGNRFLVNATGQVAETSGADQAQ